eukprot:TRINITY_DN101700_c0_g1_i1.p1 TRINITY_DN101700_c0_g1~~TRINITY_DN101700_c0_g1_i1.p1  ORF type:complete len:291 (+),score=52.06 TRINITY_DN101700_c0_g1_i1:87-959(+)
MPPPKGSSIAERHHRQSILKIKMTAAEDFAGKDVPMEEDTRDTLQLEIEALANFFSPEKGREAEAKICEKQTAAYKMQRRCSRESLSVGRTSEDLMEAHLPQGFSPSNARRASNVNINRRSSFRTQVATVLYTDDFEVPGAEKLARLKHVHRPVTPAELLDAKPPAPIGAVPPLLERQDQPDETHYSYFSRKNPFDSVNPLYRRMMAWKSEVIKKTFKCHGHLSSSAPGSRAAGRRQDDDFDYVLYESTCVPSYDGLGLGANSKSGNMSRIAWPNPRAEPAQRMVPKGRK